MKLRILSAVLVTTTVLATASVPSGASTTTMAYAQLRIVIASANAEQSVRYMISATISGKQLLFNTDVGRNTGRQRITLTEAGKSKTVLVELIAGALYVKGDEQILTTFLGISTSTSTRLANKWFTIPKNNAAFATVAQGLTLSSLMAQVAMTKSVTALPAAVLSSEKVDVLTGTSVKTALEPAYSETLYFRAAGNPLPFEVTQTFQGTLATILFSHWNETINLTAPKTTLKFG